ncbi:hypothetical protein V6N13_073585 [Hibiscus sabdariffa]
MRGITRWCQVFPWPTAFRIWWLCSSVITGRLLLFAWAGSIACSCTFGLVFQHSTLHVEDRISICFSFLDQKIKPNRSWFYYRGTVGTHCFGLLHCDLIGLSWLVAL